MRFFLVVMNRMEFLSLFLITFGDLVVVFVYFKSDADRTDDTFVLVKKMKPKAVSAETLRYAYITPSLRCKY